MDVSYAYDYAGRLVSVTDSKLTTSDKVTTYVYDEGHLLGQRYPNGVTTVFKYDPLGDASPLKHQFQHRDDSAHRLNTEWVASDTTAGTAFTLGTDFNAAPLPANRATLAYAMNLVGNRGSRTKTVAGTDPLGDTVAPTVSTYAYDGQDRATTVGGTSPTWDKKHNALTTGNGRTYQWDHGNRLTASTTGGSTATVGYDAEGLGVQAGGNRNADALPGRYDEPDRLRAGAGGMNRRRHQPPAEANIHPRVGPHQPEDHLQRAGGVLQY